MKKTVFVILGLILIILVSLIIEIIVNPVRTANKYYALKQWNDAEAIYLKANRARPDSYIINYNLGNLYFKKGDYNKAISYFQKAVEIEKGFFEGYYNLGTAYIKKGLLNEATHYYEKAKELQPNDEDLLSNISYIQFKNDNNIDAEDWNDDPSRASLPEGSNEMAKQSDDEGVTMVTDEQVESILRMYKGEEERWRESFRHDIKEAAKKDREGQEVWQKDW